MCVCVREGGEGGCVCVRVERGGRSVCEDGGLGRSFITSNDE